MSGKPLGDRGEQLAAEHLERAGWIILHRNFRVGRKEIDLVARRDEVVAFVEVKARAGLSHGHPLGAITAAKRREVEQVATGWIASFGQPSDQYRFDAVSVLLRRSGAPLVQHVEHAWWREH
jgi:putative endonuclease